MMLLIVLKTVGHPKLPSDSLNFSSIVDTLRFPGKINVRKQIISREMHWASVTPSVALIPLRDRGHSRVSQLPPASGDTAIGF
jgi:hypothetical protein